MLLNLVVLLSLAVSEPAVLIDGSFDSLYLKNQAQVLTTSEPISAHEALAKQLAGEFHPVSSRGMTYPAGKHYYWLKFRVTNTGRHAQRIYTEVRNPHVNNLRLYDYVIGDEVLTASSLTGDYHNFSSRPIEHRFFVFQSTIAAGETREFLLQADKYNESIKLPIILRGEQDFLNSTAQENAIIGIYVGIYLVIVACLVALNLVSFQGVYFSLLAYIVSFAMFVVSNTGFGFHYLWSNAPWFNSLSRPLFGAAAAIFMLIFCYFYFEVGARQPSKTRTFLLAVGSYFVGNWFCFVLYYLLIIFDLPHLGSEALKLLQLGVVLFPFYLIAIGLIHAYYDFRWKYVAFLFANIGVLTAISVIMLEEIGLVKDVFLQENFTLLALVVDFAVLGCVIGRDFYLLRIANKDLTSSLSRALLDGARQFVDGQQRERVRLAQEIHDGASARLSALQMRLSALETPDESSKRSLLNETSIIADDIRNFSHNLSSVVLERYGFVNAVEELLYGIEDANAAMDIEFIYDNANVEPKMIERELYFICLELINNVIKHSSGNHLQVVFRATEEHYTLEVNDNGAGYASEAEQTSGLGIKGIGWRLKLLDGDLSVFHAGGIQHHRAKIPRC